MVQHILRVEPDRKSLGFAELERLGQIGIEPPRRKTAEDVLTQVALRSRPRILEDNQVRIPAAVVERDGTRST